MLVLIIAVISLAVVHSTANPIHYLPFVALGKSRNWGLPLTTLTAALAASGHMIGFVLVALAGVLAGRGLSELEKFMHLGKDAGLLLFLGFGVTYTIYGIFRALKHKDCAPCENAKSCGTCGHGHERIISKADPQSWKYILFLFLMFAIGPCDAVLAMIFYYANELTYWQLAFVGLVYYAATALSMAFCTAALYKGLELFSLGGKFIDRWAHAISGLVITLSVLAAMIMGHAHTH